MDTCIIQDHYRDYLYSIDRLVERLGILADFEEKGREPLEAVNLSMIKALAYTQKGSKVSATLGFPGFTS